MFGACRSAVWRHGDQKLRLWALSPPARDATPAGKPDLHREGRGPAVGTAGKCQLDNGGESERRFDFVPAGIHRSRRRRGRRFNGSFAVKHQQVVILRTDLFLPAVRRISRIPAVFRLHPPARLRHPAHRLRRLRRRPPQEPGRRPCAPRHSRSAVRVRSRHAWHADGDPPLSSPLTESSSSSPELTRPSI